MSSHAANMSEKAAANNYTESQANSPAHSTSSALFGSRFDGFEGKLLDSFWKQI
jgi:hypothetical protein